MSYWDNQGSTPTKVTWTNPQIVPESQREDGAWYYNPQSGYVERWWSGNPSQQSSYQQPQQQQNSVDSYLNTIKDTLSAIVTPKFSQVDDYLKNNPFAYDDEWLKTTQDQVKQQVDMDPYYKEKLSNYVSDVETKKSRAMDDQETMLKELDRQEKVYTKQDTIAFQKARESALEGLSASGMVGDGSGQRDLNRAGISHDVSVNDYMSQQSLRKQQQQQATSRLLEDLGTQQSRFTTDIEREKQLNIQTEVQNLKQEKYNYWDAGLKTAQSGLGGYL